MTGHHELFSLLDLLVGRASPGDQTRFAAMAARLDAWEQRLRTRRQLAGLDDDQLADIGVSRGAARREATKPFWQP